MGIINIAGRNLNCYWWMKLTYNLWVEICLIKWFHCLDLVRLRVSSTSCSKPERLGVSLGLESRLGNRQEGPSCIAIILICMWGTNESVQFCVQLQLSIIIKHRTIEKPLQIVICPQVSRENKNRISQRIDPWGHHIQSSRTNKHQRRLTERNLFNWSDSNPFPPPSINSNNLVWGCNYVDLLWHSALA